MGTPNINNARTLVDALLSQSVALPAAGASATTASIDLIQAYSTSELFSVELDAGPFPGLTTTSISAAINLVDSADNVTFAAIPQLASISVPGVATTGAAAVSSTVKLPPTTRRYIAAQATIPTGGGNNTANNVAVTLKF